MYIRIGVLLFALSLQAAGTPQAAVDELLDADRGFANGASGKTVTAALLAMFSDDVVLPVGPRFIEGKTEAEQALRQNPDNESARVTWTPVRGGISADGQHGFTFGYLTVRKADGSAIPMKYLGYWVRQKDGWRLVTYRRRPRAAGDPSMQLMAPSLPPVLVPVSTDAATIDSHRRSLAAAERAFSDDAQKTGLEAAFTRFGRTDAINMGGPDAVGFVVGSTAIGRDVGAGTPRDSSPVSWAADHRVIVASSGDLGVTLGFIRSNDKNKQDQPPIAFFTIWRRDTPTSPWRYIAE
jgi:ketosteroid isomerase-like protein